MPNTDGRVVAWFLTVVNPILDGLRPIEYYLARRRWTWRYRTGFFEVLFPPKAIVPLHYHPNYDDFVDENPPVGNLASSYDKALRGLAESCAAAHEGLVSDPAFVREVEAADAEYPPILEKSAPRGAYARSWWGGLQGDKKAHIVAERVVNNLDEDLVDQYSDQLFWNSFRARFLEFRTRGAHKDRFERMNEVGIRALESGRALANSLKSIRSALARQYGVPPVPVD